MGSSKGCDRFKNEKARTDHQSDDCVSWQVSFHALEFLQQASKHEARLTRTARPTQDNDWTESAPTLHFILQAGVEVAH